MLDNEHITWSDHIRKLESKIAKNIPLLHRARQLLTEASLKSVCLSYIHSHLNYVTFAWNSANVQN